MELRALKRIALLSFVSLCPGFAYAQTTTNSNPDEPEDEIVRLSPFQVVETEDVGYRATNTTSGTSLNTAIKDLPMTIQVVTAEFIKDIGATDFTEALAYSSGVFTETQEAPGGDNTANANEGGGSAERSVSAGARGNRFANVVTIRGFDVPFQTRLGFRVGGLVVTPTTNIALGGLLDSVNMDRLEVVKGPNSLLYGVGVLSGIVNAIPKKPTAKPTLEVTGSAGSFGFRRTTIDASTPILRKGKYDHSLNIRVAGAWEKREHYTDWQTKSQRYNVAQLEYFFRDKLNVFVEFQRAKTKFNGTGDQWIFDDAQGSDPFFRNEWDEAYNYARQQGPIAGLDLVKRQVITHDNRGRPLRTPRVNLVYTEPDPTKRQMMGGGLPDTYRITGPDTYEMREEDNFLINIDVTPIEKLALSGGIYYTKQDTEELNLNVMNMTDGGGGFEIRDSLTAIGDNEYTGPGGPWPDQPSIGYDVWSVANPFFIERDDLNPDDVNPLDSTKLTRYWWSKRPTSSESIQWRLRGTYTVDVDLPVVGATSHTFLAGNHFINDKVKFLNGEETIVRAYNRQTPDDDALYFRSVTDYSPFRYNGENLAMPGTRYSEQDIWFKGFYGVYQGKFWNDRIGAIAGVRYDEYNASTKDFIRLVPDRTAGLTREQIQAQELGYVNNPNNETYGAFDATDNFPKPISKWSKTLALNYKITDMFTVYGLYSEGIAPNTGLADGNNQFIEAEETTSKEVGVKFSSKNNRLTGSISAYQIERKNAIWDFEYAPAPSKWTGSPNPPVGLALTSNRFDPKPDIGVQVLTYGINAKETPSAFQNAYITGNSSTFDPVTQHKVYYITTRDPAGNPIRQQIPGLIDFANPGGTADSPQIFYVKYADMDVPFDFAYTENGALVTQHFTWRQFFEKAFFNEAVSADVPGQYDPLNYTRQESFFGEWKGGNNPSLNSSDGANVTFADESRGVDLEVIFQPNDNLQFLVNYSYTERKAKGAFEMVDFVSLEDGEIFAGTEYDRIVRVFGREAFGIKSEDTNGDGFADKFTDQHGTELSETNPLRPSEAVGGIDGVSLFFNPAHQATFWSRYEFTEGVLNNLGIGLGAQYSSAAPTAVSIGGSEVGRNLFPTPDTEANWNFNAGLYYEFKVGRTRWNLRLNINNLFDDGKDVTTVSYQDEFNDRTVNKRSEVYRFPRSFRFSASVAF
jgi:outer membrane receptor protein involved in Fe transport